MTFGARLAAVSAVLAIAAASPAAAQNFSQFVAFGDSTIDSGWFRFMNLSPNATLQALQRTSVANGGAIPTTPNGPMNSTLLASYFGLTANPADQPGGGTNFAASGAQDIAAGFNRPSTVSQITSYLAAGGANPNALYLISSGGNDIGKDIVPQFQAGTINLAQAQQLTVQSANALSGAIQQLHGAGARYILVPNMSFAGSNNPGSTSAQLSALYYQNLWPSLSAAGVNFVPADMQSVLAAVRAAPAAYGIQFTANTLTGTACINPNPGLIANSWALYCTPALLRAPNAGQIYLWADDEHLSAAGQKIEADYYYSLLVAPSEISFLAENAVQATFATITGIQQQIAISQRQRPEGANAWFNGTVSRLGIDNSSTGFPSDPSTPVSGTFGLDYHWRNGWLVGGAVTLGHQKPGFSLGGDFTQDEVAVSLYTRYQNGPWWGDLIGSYGHLRYDVNRLVPIGITVQSNNGSTAGSDWSLAGEFGYDFKAGWLTHGPVAGMVLQRVRVNGFTESGSYTSLSFGDQTRNSEVSALGYRVSAEYLNWRPFAQIVWDHEFDSLNRSVTAALTTIAAPSYSMPAVVTGRDWATATVGTELKLAPSWTALASFTAQIGQQHVTNYGGLIGINYAFATTEAAAGPRIVK